MGFKTLSFFVFVATVYFCQINVSGSISEALKEALDKGAEAIKEGACKVKEAGTTVIHKVTESDTVQKIADGIDKGKCYLKEKGEDAKDKIKSLTSR